MSDKKCNICGKTAYPLESVNAIEKVFHKLCFKCSVCQITLNLKNYKGFEGKIYCATHTPTVKSTAVTDSISMKHALNAPKKTAEGLGTAQKGTGEKPSVGLDTISTQNALKAPKKTAEGLGTAHKGVNNGEQPAVDNTYGHDEAPQEYSHHQEEAPQEYYEAPAEEAPQEYQEEAPQEYYEAPAEEAPQEESEW